jgi:hypothetical protein
VSSEASGASSDADDAEKAQSREDGSWSVCGERRSVQVPDAIGVQQRESGVLIEMTKRPLESDPMRQTGVRRLKAMLSCGAERSRE